MLNPSKLNFLKILSILVVFLLVVACSEISKDALAQNNNNLKFIANTPETADLVKSVKSNDIDRVKELINSGVDLNVRDEKGYTLIQIVMGDVLRYRNTDMLELLLKSGLSPDSEILIGTDPVERALVIDDDKSALLLFQYGADVNTKYNDRTVLIDSLVKEKKALSAYLITHGARVNDPNQIGRTPLFYVNGNSEELVQLLIDNGADVNFKDKDGLTPLFIAVSNDDIKLVAALVENGANVNEKDKDNWTPLQQAFVSGCADLVEYLEHHNAVL